MNEIEFLEKKGWFRLFISTGYCMWTNSKTWKHYTRYEALYLAKYPPLFASTRNW